MKIIENIMACINLEQMLFEKKGIKRTSFFFKALPICFILEVAFDLDSDIGLISRRLYSNSRHICL